MNGVVWGRIIMSEMVWGRGGAGRQGKKGFPPPPNLLGAGAGPLFLLLCPLK